MAALASASIDSGAAPPQAGATPGARPADLVDRLTWLDRELDGELTRRAAELGGARVGLAVRDLATGHLIYGHDADAGFNLASNAKVVTAAAILHALGPGFTWRTGLYAEAIEKGAIGELFIRGRGNPRLGTEHIDALAADLAAIGVTKVGRLAVDSTYFDAVDSPPHFDEKPEEQAYFRAPVGATSLNFDAVRLSVRPSPSGRGPAIVAIDPPSSYTHLEAKVATVTRGRSRVRIEQAEIAGRLEITVLGQLRADDPPMVSRRRVSDPLAYLAAVLRARLTAHGIEVGPGARMAAIPGGARLLAEHESEPLSVVVRDLGKHSNNYVAEMLLKTLGAEVEARGTRPATWDDGLTAVRRYLTSVVGLPTDSYYIGNGSGLYQASRMSPDQLTRVLLAAHDDYRYGPDLVASLSVAAVDGTLARRMVNGPAARRVRAKTGTLNAVSTLAGYLALDGEAPLAFAVLIDGAPGSATNAARALQDAVCEILVHYLEASRGAAPPTIPSGAPTTASDR